MEKNKGIITALQKKRFFCVCMANGGQGAGVRVSYQNPDTEGEDLFLRNKEYKVYNNNNNNILYYIILYIMQNIGYQYKILVTMLVTVGNQVFAGGPQNG